MKLRDWEKYWGTWWPSGEAAIKFWKDSWEDEVAACQFSHSRLALASFAGGCAKVLDYGCGGGLQEVYLRGFGSYFGADVTHSACVATKHYTDRPAVQAVLRCLPFRDNQFDAVIGRHVFEHIAPDDLTESIYEINRVARFGAAHAFFLPPQEQSEYCLTEQGYYNNVYRKEELIDLILGTNGQKIEISELLPDGNQVWTWLI